VIPFFGVLAAVILAAYLWNRTAQNRIVEAMDLAVEETERLWASDFSRPTVFAATAVEQVVSLADSDEPEAEAEEEEPSPASDESDATSYYREAEGQLADVRSLDRDVVRRWLETGETPEPPTALSEALDRGGRAMAFVEKGLAETRCSPWDTPLHGAGMRTPNPEAHRFIHALFLVRAALAKESGRHEDAASDVLRALAYSQDLCRHSLVSTRFHFAALQAQSAIRLQELISAAPLGQGALDLSARALTLLDETDPPASQTLRMERLNHLISLGKAATTDLGPGRVPFLAGIFDLRSTHQIADASQAALAAFGRLEKQIDEPVAKSGAGVESVADELRRSTNPIVSNLVPHPERLQAVVAEASRQLRLAQVAAAVQLYRLTEGDFPSSLNLIKGKTLRRLPVDPVGGGAFRLRPPDEASPAKVSTGGDEERAPRTELVLERTVPPSASPDSLPAGVRLRGP
jgi:hypothetical protein